MLRGSTAVCRGGSAQEIRQCAGLGEILDHVFTTGSDDAYLRVHVAYSRAYIVVAWSYLHTSVNRVASVLMNGLLHVFASRRAHSVCSAQQRWA